MSAELTYKEYSGSVEVSIEDGCLHGRVLFINDLITYEGNTVDELKTAFQNATDQYIAYCEKTGKPANKPYSGTFNVRIGADRHRALARLAHKKKTSINEVLCQAIDAFQQGPHLQADVSTAAAAFRQAIPKPASTFTNFVPRDIAAAEFAVVPTWGNS